MIFTPPAASGAIRLHQYPVTEFHRIALATSSKFNDAARNDFPGDGVVI
jgi:hypothetical protein